MTTAIDICNAALAEIEEAPIEAFVDGTEAARQCAANFFVCARAVLREYPWSCATAMATLAASADTPIGWKYAYLLPVDCLYVRTVDDSERTDYWRVQGRNILTGIQAPLTIVYTRDLTIDPITGVNVTGGERLDFDALCADAVAMRLAARIAKRITGSDSTADMMAAKYLDALRTAISVDATEQRLPPLEEPGYLEAGY